MQLLQNILPLTLVGLAAAFDPAVDTLCQHGTICLSSFKWCLDEPFTNDCHYPQGTSSFWASSGNIAILHREHEFDVEWRNADPSLPVTIQWISRLPGTMPLDDGESDRHTVQIFETTVPNKDGKSSGTYRFKPQTILNQYEKNPSPNVTIEAAWLAAYRIDNRLHLSQPGVDYANADRDLDYYFQRITDEFVLGDWQLDMLVNGTQRRFDEKWNANQKQWSLGVGIGVGVGLPLLVALTWFFATRRANAKKVKCSDSMCAAAKP